MSRIIAAIALIAVLVVGGGIIATTAYQAGLTTAVSTTATEAGATVVTPVVVPHAAYGWGWGGPGFGIFGFLIVLAFLFLVFGLIRAVMWGGRPGRGGPGRDHRDHWRDRARPYFEELHREAHAGTTAADTAAGSMPPLS